MGVFEALNNVANIYDIIGKHEKAFEAYQELLLLKKNEYEKAVILKKIGDIQHSKGDVEECFETYKECLFILLCIPQGKINPLIIQSMCSSLAFLCLENGDVTNAWNYYKMAKENMPKDSMQLSQCECEDCSDQVFVFGPYVDSFYPVAVAA